MTVSANLSIYAILQRLEALELSGVSHLSTKQALQIADLVRHATCVPFREVKKGDSAPVDERPASLGSEVSPSAGGPLSSPESSFSGESILSRSGTSDTHSAVYPDNTASVAPSLDEDSPSEVRPSRPRRSLKGTSTQDKERPLSSSTQTNSLILTRERAAELDHLSEMSDRVEALKILGSVVSRCTRCLNLISFRTQTVLGAGNPYASLMFIGEAPGADEDRQGVPFVGRAGKLLTDMIEKGMKLSRDEDTYICNILRCRPPGNRTPMPDEAGYCREYLDTQIEIVRPKYICCLGTTAAQSLLGTPTTIGRLRGRVHDYHGISVICTYHPAYLLRNPSMKVETWADIKLLMSIMNE